VAVASAVAHGLLFAASGVGFVLAMLSFRWERLYPIGRRTIDVAAGLGVTGLIFRTIASGHLPLFGTHENTWAAATAVLLLVSVGPHFNRLFEPLWRWMSLWPLALMVYGTGFRSEPVALTISEQSVMVDIHVLFAWTAFVCLLSATTVSLLRLFRRLPAGRADEDAERLHDRLLLIGYLAFTTMLTIGALYLWVLFATPWRWEIVGTLSLLAWLLYGLLIHGRLFYRWHGAWYDAGVVAVLPVLMLAFWIWSVFPGTYHFFDIPLVRPY